MALTTRCLHGPSDAQGQVVIKSVTNRPFLVSLLSRRGLETANGGEAIINQKYIHTSACKEIGRASLDYATSHTITGPVHARPEDKVFPKSSRELRQDKEAQGEQGALQQLLVEERAPELLDLSLVSLAFLMALACAP